VLLSGTWKKAIKQIPMNKILVLLLIEPFPMGNTLRVRETVVK